MPRFGVAATAPLLQCPSPAALLACLLMLVVVVSFAVGDRVSAVERHHCDRVDGSQLQIRKCTLPPSPIDTRQRSVTVVVEWHWQPDRSKMREDCRYVVRVTDTIPPLPLRVPNADARCFSTTHNQSYVHREYHISFEEGSSPTLQDSWNYTLSIQPVSLSPLNESIEIEIPSPTLSVFSIQGRGNPTGAIAHTLPSVTPTLTIKLIYSPPFFSLTETLWASLAFVMVVAICHILSISRLQMAVRTREELQRQKEEASKGPLDTRKPVKVNPLAKKVRTGDPQNNDAAPHHAGENDASPPTPHRFKAKSTRKRFTRSGANSGSLDF